MGMKKSRVFLVLLVLLVTLLAGCANQNGEGAAIADIRQLDGQTIGVMTGSTFDQHTDTYINDAKKSTIPLTPIWPWRWNRARLRHFSWMSPWPGCCAPRTRG